MSDNPGWAAWRRNFDMALQGYFSALVDDASCHGTASHDGCGGVDCDITLGDIGHDPNQIMPGSANAAEEDLYGFVTSCLAERPDCFDRMTPAMVGYDFYLTRNGHGVGFWDRGLGELGDWLTAMAEPYGEASAYVGDDGSLYYWNS